MGKVRDCRSYSGDAIAYLQSKLNPTKKCGRSLWKASGLSRLFGWILLLIHDQNGRNNASGIIFGGNSELSALFGGIPLHLWNRGVTPSQSAMLASLPEKPQVCYVLGMAIIMIPLVNQWTAIIMFCAQHVVIVCFGEPIDDHRHVMCSK